MRLLATDMAAKGRQGSLGSLGDAEPRLGSLGSLGMLGKRLGSQPKSEWRKG